MTVQDIINDVRPKLADTFYPYQWIDGNYYTPINDGIREIVTKFPHALYVTAVTTTMPSDVAAVGDEVLIIDEFRNKLVELVVIQLLQEDKERKRAIIEQQEESAQ
jgi:hypothetical protein